MSAKCHINDTTNNYFFQEVPMPILTKDEYTAYIKNERDRSFPTPYELAYKSFCDLELINKGPHYFLTHASEVVDLMRAKCWEEFLIVEKEFTTRMLTHLINADCITNKTASEAVTWFASTYPDHIYALNLSNTQSRRSRAGKEFEAIIELILMGADLPMDSQGKIGKKIFLDKGLGKMVDVVTPGVIEFTIDKNDTILISAKTTLRERWQEVPEEMGRTGAGAMFLATLDENISNEVLETLYESNIRLTTTQRIKAQCYPNNRRVLTFEQLIEKCNEVSGTWEEYEFDQEIKEQLLNKFTELKNNNSNKTFISQYYQNRIDELTD